MRRSSQRFLTAVLVIGLTACSGDDDPTGPGDIIPTNGTMSATIDGNTWTAIQIAGVNNGGVVAISGSDATLLAVGFAFVGQAAGTYTIGPASAANASVIDNLTTTWTANSFQGSGTITVSTLTATGASGTFSYTAPLTSTTGTPATRVVTNGTFNVTF